LSGQQIGTVLGGAVGAFFGGPAGAQIGMAIGGLVGGIVDPTKIDGPKIGQGQQQTSTDGAPIAWVLGTARIAGTLVQVSSRRDVKVHDSGKGGPSVSHHEAHQDFCIQVCESSSTRNSVMSSVIMVEQDGKIVYDARSNLAIGQGAVLPPGYVANTTAALVAFGKWKAGVAFQYGPETQLPHPTLEAITGVGNCPSYRGTLTMVASDFNVTAVGDRVPSYVFTVASSVLSSPKRTVIGGTAQYASAGGTGLLTTIGALLFDAGQPALPPYAFCSLPGPYVGVCVRAILRDKTNGFIYWDSTWVGTADIKPALIAYLAANPGAGGGVDAQYTVGDGKDPQYYVTTGSRVVFVGVNNRNLVADLYWFNPGSSKASLMQMLVYSAGALNPGDPGSLTLADAVTRICVRGGLTAADIDVTGLAGIDVLGYAIATQCNGVAALTPLLQAYFCYGSEYDGKIHFKRLGADAVMTIDEDDLILNEGANDGSVVSTKRGQDTQYPAKITVAYVDPAQNYQPVTISESRLASNVNAIGEVTIPLSVTMGADEAKQAAQKAMKIAYAGLEGTQ
jgi:hypothetical protein